MRNRSWQVRYLVGTSAFAALAIIGLAGCSRMTDDERMAVAVEAHQVGDYVAAMKGFRGLARKGHDEAQFYLGVMYNFGEGVTRDQPEAARWFRLAAEQGHTVAQHNLGLMYHIGDGVARDQPEAARWFRLAAEQGHAVARHDLGVMYYNGEGVSRDQAEAARWFRLAAEQGHAKAQFNLGLMVYNGEGVARDQAEAARWYRLAAEQGHGDAQMRLGIMYASGEGVARDGSEAARWFRLAAEQGDADAQFILAELYTEGRGVVKDPAETERWLRAAAEQGVTEAQSRLGWMYYRGGTVAKDLAEALKWFRMAARGGEDGVLEVLAYLEGTPPSVQILFLEIIDEYSAQWRVAATDAQRRRVREARGAAFREAISGGRAVGWTGRVVSVREEEDVLNPRGVYLWLEVELLDAGGEPSGIRLFSGGGNGCYLLGDQQDHLCRPIESRNPVSNSVGNLLPGTDVRFTGRFALASGLSYPRWRDYLGIHRRSYALDQPSGTQEVMEQPRLFFQFTDLEALP